MFWKVHQRGVDSSRRVRTKIEHNPSGGLESRCTTYLRLCGVLAQSRVMIGTVDDTLDHANEAACMESWFEDDQFGRARAPRSFAADVYSW